MAANITKSGTPSVASLMVPPTNQLTKIAKNDMAAGDMVYIKSDDTFDLCNGTSADALAQWWGMVARACKAGQPVTAFHSCLFHYGASLTVGARYYISATAGALYDTATTGGDVPCAFAVDAEKIYVMAPRK